jgi:divalent metal cation (Fe/Co/Zn/Cd) transporter
VAKSVAAVVTGSASLTAEAAHSWADTGNELFLAVANRRSARPPDRAHPLGHGREAYVWSLFAALGLFVAGGAVSISHGVNELRAPTPAEDFLVGYLVVAVSFVLEGTSFLLGRPRRHRVDPDRPAARGRGSRADQPQPPVPRR